MHQKCSMPVQVNKVKITFARRKMTAYGGFALIAAFFGQIGFMGGLTGALFTEFAYTLAGAVAVSAVVALTLSPMMCSRFLKSYDNKRRHRFVDFVDRQFDRLSRGYQGLLREGLNYLPVVGVFAALILVSVYFLYASSKSELAPQEGQGVIISLITAAPNASLEQTQLSSRKVFELLDNIRKLSTYFSLMASRGSTQASRAWSSKRGTSARGLRSS